MQTNGQPLPAKPGHSIITLQQDVARIDARACMALLGCGRSYFYELVRAGDFPAPIVKKPRYVRWALGDVRKHLQAVNG